MAQMTHRKFYGRDGLRVDDMPFITVEPDTGTHSVRPGARMNRETTDQALDEITRRWNAYEELIPALDALLACRWMQVNNEELDAVKEILNRIR